MSRDRSDGPDGAARADGGTASESGAGAAGAGAGASPRIRSALEGIERAQSIRRVLTIAGVLAVVLTAMAAATYLGFTLASIWRQLPTFLSSLVAFLTPDFHFFTLYSTANDLRGWNALIGSLLNPGSLVNSVLNRNQGLTIVGGAVATILIGFTGTVLGFPLALLFGVLGSERVTPFPFNFVFRGTMSTIRAIPALVWVLIYVPLVGISPVGAMLAVGTDTIGNLGRLFTDELEEVEDGPIEAISSTGASSSQTVVFGMLSQVSTSFVAWTLYILEINVRIAVSLGVVGAGGIGQYVKGRIGLLKFSEAAAGILMIIVIVLSVELLSSRLRARLRPGEHEGRSVVDVIMGLGDGGKWFGRDVEKR